MARQISRTINAQASVLLVYCICLFLIGLAQVSLGIALRLVYMIQLHIYCYPDWSGCLTLLPFLVGVLYFIFKGKCLTILLSITSLLSFLGAVAFTGILLVETHLYDLIRFKINEIKMGGSSASNAKSYNSTDLNKSINDILTNRFSKTDPASLNAAYNDKWFYILVFMIFGLSLLQALLSVVGMVLAFVWSPCCQQSYTPLRNQNSIENTNGRKTLRINGVDLSENGETCLLKMKHFDDV